MLSSKISSKMMQDFILTSNMMVDMQSPNPLAVFQNYGGQTEVAAILGDHTLYHVYRDSATDSGWNRMPISSNHNVLETAIGVNTDGTIHLFYTDSQTLYHATLGQDSSWTTSGQTFSTCHSLAVTNAPFTNSLILSGITPGGDLQLVQFVNSSELQSSVVSFGGVLKDSPYVLQMQSATAWVLAAVTNGVLNLYTGSGSVVASGPQAIPTAAPASQVMMAYMHQSSPMFLFTDTNNTLYTNVGFSDQVTVIPNSMVSGGMGSVDSQQMIHFYGIDPQGTLWVLHQTGWGGNGPVWAPYIPLDVNLRHISGSSSAGNNTNLFGVGDDGTLHYISLDKRSRAWSKTLIQQPNAEEDPYPVTTYNSEIIILNEYGNPLPNCPLTISSDSQVALWINGTTYHVNNETPAQVSTGSMGSINILTPTTGLGTPQITVAADGLDPVTFNAANEVQNYLSGQGTINYLSGFSGQTLQSATVPDRTQTPDRVARLARTSPTKPLAANLTTAQADAAAAAIQASLCQSTGTPCPSAGWSLDLSDPNNPKFQTFEDSQALEAHRARFFPNPELGVMGNLWNDVERFASDIWNGIKTAASKILHWVVDAVQGVMHAVMQVGEEIVYLANLAIEGIKDVISIVESIFAAIAAAIEDVIEWLKVFFSFGDIWDTMLALNSAVAQFPGFLEGWINIASEKLEDGFFGKMKDDVNRAFTALESKFAGQSMGGLVSSVAPPANPSDPKPNGAQTNWMINKTTSYPYTPPDVSSSAVNEPLANLVAAMKSSVMEFEAAVKDFADAIMTMLTDPDNFATLGIAEFLQGVQNLILAALDFMDAIVQAFLELAYAAISVSSAVLFNAPLRIPLVTPLVHLFQKLAAPGTPPIDVTISTVFSLAFAFPLTWGYKLLHGADAELFPGGVLPTAPSMALVATERAESTASEVCKYTGMILQMINGAYTTGLDASLKGEAVPFSLKVGGIVLPALIQIFTWPGTNSIPFGELHFNTLADWLNFASWMDDWVPIDLDITFMALGAEKHEGVKVQTNLARYDDVVGITALTVVGAIELAVGAIDAIWGDRSLPGITIDLLSGLEDLFQFLRYEPLVEFSESLTYWLKLVIDFFTQEGVAVAMAAS